MISLLMSIFYPKRWHQIRQNQLTKLKIVKVVYKLKHNLYAIIVHKRAIAYNAFKKYILKVNLSIIGKNSLQMLARCHRTM